MGHFITSSTSAGLAPEPDVSFLDVVLPPLPTVSKPSSSSSAAVCGLAPSSSESESESDISSSVDSIFSRAAATPAAMTGSSLWCLRSLCLIELNAFELVDENFLMVGLSAKTASTESSRRARHRK